MTLALPFLCKKAPATSREAMVTANQPLASLAGAEILAAGGNAFDAALAVLTTLSVTEPMMVGVLGAGLIQIRLPSGQHLALDALANAPSAARADMFTPAGPGAEDPFDTLGQANLNGPQAVAVPGSLLAWTEMHRLYGRLPRADCLDPAIRWARRGFEISPYLAGAIRDCAPEMSKDAAARKVYLPGGEPLPPGARLVQSDMAQSLQLIAKEGAAALYGGQIGQKLIERLQSAPAPAGIMQMQDLLDYALIWDQPLEAEFRGFTVHCPPPPASGGVAMAQMLARYAQHADLRQGFDDPERLQLLIDIQHEAFADRAGFGTEGAAQILSEANLTKPLARPAPHSPAKGRDTTHMSVVDRDGTMISATSTLYCMFGAQIMLPETGLMPNNYMRTFDPVPGRAMSIAPGKRTPASMAPVIVTKAGTPAYAIGMPGGTRIFPSIFQTLVNLIDLKMDLQSAVEAPRVWSEGGLVEVEPGLSHRLPDLQKRNADLRPVPHIGGGMAAIAMGDGLGQARLTGATCWRADGHAVGISGENAAPEVRFWPRASTETP
ncbi:gamma-glutamyltransferase family protein [Xinfangfangia sp. CPCC 101601]|uniref:Gamma-glutamyltransferase family protein n=1 Tax=Pseudogemmobacter lacusdianii TaxID=3069608 RepID=A0ABU0W160_9RHOB|nr:gamma-glutamyltransferase family protein [Xinfangfangia sp. CPCC 101601]MDQ2067751.1 gamma-glutamyltransferase family protein [Xinfangfangia sp. CPCC 101601]